MNAHEYSLPSGLILLLLPATLTATPPLINVIVDIGAQHENTTVERTLEVSGSCQVALIIAGIDPASGYDVAIQIGGLEMPTLAISPTAMSGRIGLSTAITGISRGAQSINDSGPHNSREETSPLTFATATPGDVLNDSGSMQSRYCVPGRSSLLPGQRMTVVVRRLGEEKEHRWTAVVISPARGTWRISFGFAFAVMVNPDHEYAARHDTDDQYVVRRVTDPPRVEPTPAVMLHWFPTQDQWTDWSWSIAAGLGLDITSPMVMIGGSLTFNQNLSFAGGLMAMKLKRLDPRYEEGMRIEEDPGADQLHREVYGVNPFLSLSFRFADGFFGK